MWKMIPKYHMPNFITKSCISCSKTTTPTFALSAFFLRHAFWLTQRVWKRANSANVGVWLNFASECWIFVQMFRHFETSHRSLSRRHVSDMIYHIKIMSPQVLTHLRTLHIQQIQTVNSRASKTLGHDTCTLKCSQNILSSLSHTKHWSDFSFLHYYLPHFKLSSSTP